MGLRSGAAAARRTAYALAAIGLLAPVASSRGIETTTHAAVPTATPPTLGVSINLGSAVGASGSYVSVTTTFASSGPQVVGTANDITFDRTALSIGYCVLYEPLQLLGKTLLAGIVAYTQTTATLRVLVLDAGQPPYTLLPDGPLYICPFQILRGAPPGTYTLANSNPVAVGTAGLPVGPVTGLDGQIVVPNGQMATATAAPTATPAPPQITFAPLQVYEVTPASTYNLPIWSITAGPFDLSGYLDLAVAGPGFATAVFQDGLGKFSRQDILEFSMTTAHNAAATVRTGDFDNDGNFDLAIGQVDGVQLFLGDGAGGFLPQSMTTATAGDGVNRQSMQLGDFDQDGYLDAVVAEDCSVQLLLGNGALNPDAAVILSSTQGVGGAEECLDMGLATGDFDGDGNRDVATTDGLEKAYLIPGDGKGFLKGPQPLPGCYEGPTDVLAAPLFAASQLDDLAVLDHDGVYVLHNEGGGNFSLGDTAFGNGGFALAAADFNGDGLNDIAVANPYGGATVDVLAGDGNGRFAAPQSFTVFDTPVALALGDYNADGKPDIALSNTSGLVGVLINATTPWPTPTGCMGDCSGEGMVTVDELVRGIAIALGSATSESCPAIDGNRDGSVAVHELVRAVRHALTGCPASRRLPQ